MDVGSVFVRLGAHFDKTGFDKFDRAAEQARRKKGIEARLGGKLDDRAFKQYEDRLQSAEKRTKRRDAFKAHLGADFDAKAFNAYEREIARVERETKKAEHQSGLLGRTTGTLGGHLKRAAGYALAAGSAYAGIAAVKGSISTTEELAKTTLTLHKNLGLSVDSASAFAAVLKSRGVETKQVGQLFGTLSKNIDAANKGGTAQIGVFERLGLSQRELKTLKPEETMDRLADGFKKLGPGPERTALGMRLFGRGWQAMLPLLRDGSVGLKEQTDLVEKYGATLKGKSVEEIKKLIAAQRESKIATMGLQVAFGTMLAPALTKAISAVNGFVLGIRHGTGAGGRFRDKVEEIWKEMKPVVTWMGRAVANVTKFVDKHPALQKVAVGVIAVGLALKALRFTAALTGIDKVLNGFRAIARTRAGQRAKEAIADGLSGLWSRIRAGVTMAVSRLVTAFGGGGRRAGDVVAETITHRTGTGMEARKPRWTSLGTRIGRWIGPAIGIAAAIEIAPKIQEWFDKNVLNINPKARQNAEEALPGSTDPAMPFKKKLLPWNWATGGLVPQYFQVGGGPKGSDTVPAWLTPGEFVMRREAVQQHGVGTMKALNKGAGLGEALAADRSKAKAPLSNIAKDLMGLVAAGQNAGRKTAKALTDRLTEGHRDTRKVSKLITKEVGGDFEDLRKDADRSTKRLAKSTEDRFDDIRKDSSRNAKRTSDTVTDEFSDMRRATGRHLDRMARTARDRFEDIVSSGRRQGGRLSSSVRSSMSSVDSAVHTGLSYIASATSEALKAFDAKPISLSVPKPKGFARGSWVGAPGERGHDEELVLMGRGEAVLTRHQQAPIEAALGLANLFGLSPYGSLDELFASERRPHFMARGGRLRRFQGGGLSGPHGSGEGFTPLANLAFRRFGLQVTAGRTDHSTNTISGNVSDHSWGGAIDLSNGSSPTSQMDAYARWASRVLGHTAFHPGSNSGPPALKQLLYRTMIGGNHFNHVHTAMQRAFAFSARKVAALIGGGDYSTDLPKLRVAGAAGPMHVLVQTALDRVRKGGQHKLDDVMAVLDSGAMGPESSAHASPPGALSRRQVEGLWVRAGGPRSYAHQMANIAWSESRWDPHATNPTDHGAGLWQITPPEPGSYNALTNARQAVRKFQEAQRIWGDPLHPWNASRSVWQQRSSAPARALGGFLESFRGGGRRRGARWHQPRRHRRRHDRFRPRGSGPSPLTLGRLLSQRLITGNDFFRIYSSGNLQPEDVEGAIEAQSALAGLTPSPADDIFWARQHLAETRGHLQLLRGARPPNYGDIASVAGDVRSAQDELAELLAPPEHDTGNDTADLEARTAQAEERARVARESYRLLKGAFQTFTGSGDIGAGAYTAFGAAMQPYGTQGAGPGYSSQRQWQELGSPPWQMAPQITIQTLHPGDTRTLDAIARASNAGNSLQPYRPSPRERVNI